MALFYEDSNLEYIVKQHCKYFGLDGYGDEMTVLKRAEHWSGYTAFFKKEFNLDLHLGKDPVKDAMEDIFKPLYEQFTNSQWHKDIQESHQKELKLLEDKIKYLEEENAKLTDALTNGTEYLEGLDESNDE